MALSNFESVVSHLQIDNNLTREWLAEFIATFFFLVRSALVLIKILMKSNDWIINF